MRSVLTIEAEGISKFWKMKVMTKSPTARTVQMEASDSRGVSVSSVWVVVTSAVSGCVVFIPVLLQKGLCQCIAEWGGIRKKRL